MGLRRSGLGLRWGLWWGLGLWWGRAVWGRRCSTLFTAAVAAADVVADVLRSDRCLRSLRVFATSVPTAFISSSICTPQIAHVLIDDTILTLAHAQDGMQQHSPVKQIHSCMVSSIRG